MLSQDHLLKLKDFLSLMALFSHFSKKVRPFELVSPCLGKCFSLKYIVRGRIIKIIKCLPISV